MSEKYVLKFTSETQLVKIFHCYTMNLEDFKPCNIGVVAYEIGICVKSCLIFLY
jgi:hypothetical protein